jgi:DNA-binding MarR family transcriptional regulator
MSSSSLPETSDPLALANGLRPILLQITRQMRREARTFGVSPTQVAMLAALMRSPDISLRELAALEGMTAPTVSGHMQRLEAAGLIARSRATSDDRRRVDVSVTDEGARVLLAVREQRTAWLARQLATLTPEERGIILAALGPLAKLVQA